MAAASLLLLFVERRRVSLGVAGFRWGFRMSLKSCSLRQALIVRREERELI